MNTHDTLRVEVQNPAEDCNLPEPIRPEGDAGIFVVADCAHGTKFLLVTQYDGNVWMDAEKYWAESRGMYADDHLFYPPADPYDETEWNF
jgi:hypothetical protein